MITKQELLEQWAGELLNVKAQLLQVSWLLQQGVLLTRQQEDELNELIDRRKRLEQLIEEVRKIK